MNPVMKQYAAMGKVARSGSTSFMMCAFVKTVEGETHNRLELLGFGNDTSEPLADTG